MADMKDDADLSGMNADSAKEYVFGFITALKQLDIEIARAGEEAETWRKRVSLAESRGLADLKTAAENKAVEVETSLADLRSRHEELAAKISTMKSKLPLVKSLERSVDTDLLLAQLEMATGETMNPGAAAVEAEMKEMEADAALQGLKGKPAGEA
ncbi:MAG: chromosome partitioning protein [Spirochaetes bacterium]|nr:chromosome partitioning protein [Spirochaetota bacterium]